VHTPALFIGDDALIGEEELSAQNLERLMNQYAPAGAERVWTGFVPGGLLNDIPSVLTIVVSGLVDGLNPCAFATLIFFIAYLSANGRRGREILAVGGAFTLGVFLAYMLVGLGLYKAIDLLQDRVPFIKTLSPWVYVLTALFCLVLAVLSFRDFLKARQGQVEDMSLSLPEKLRSRTRFIIREGQRVRAYVASAFVTGLIVSLLELACTGQLYLPTIIYMTSVSALRSQGVLYLLLYNLCFILPLVVVFALTYLGTSSMQLGLVLKRRTAAVKLGTAALFVLLAAWLILTAAKASGSPLF
jgi:cytochrome c biogenesis protein CcdA